MKTLILTIILFTTLYSASFSQDKVELSDFEFNPQFRSVQLDGSFGIWSKKIGGAIDYDLFSNKTKKQSWLSLGLRTGADVI